MDAWWPRLVQAEFGRVLGRKRDEPAHDMLATGRTGSAATPAAPDFYAGWWGYVNKDLRKLFGRRARRAAGRGVLRPRVEEALPQALRRALPSALGVSRKDLYGHAGDCASNAQALCWDKNRFTVAAAIDVPPTSRSRTGRRSSRRSS